LSKELARLAKHKTLQQAEVISETLFGSFSQAGESLVTALLRHQSNDEVVDDRPLTPDTEDYANL
jgi:hypothetical protein